jgi:hypothetical protein
LGQALADLGDRIADIISSAIAISNKKLTVVLEEASLTVEIMWSILPKPAAEMIVNPLFSELKIKQSWERAV